MLRVFAAVLLAVAASVSHAQWRTAGYPPEGGAALGIGWNTILRAPADAYCVEFALLAEPAQDLDVVTEEFRLVDKLNRTATNSNELKVTAAPGASGSFKLTFSNTYDFSVEDQSYAVVARVQNSPEVAGPPPESPLRLKPKYVEMLRQEGGMLQFSKECGDSFILRRMGGAQLVALATVKDLSEESRSEVTLNYGAQGVVFDVKGARDDKVTRTSLEKSTKFSYLLRGGVGAEGAVDVASLNALIKTLAKLAKEAPRYWQIDLRRYETLPNWPAGLNQPVHDIRLLLASAMYARLRQIESVAADALSNRAAFISDSVFEYDLETIVVDTRAALLKLEAQILDCTQEVGKCAALPEKDKFDYYWYYTRLPLRRGANQFDQGKLKLQAALATQKTKTAEALEKLQPLVRPPLRPMTCEKLLSPPPVVRVPPGRAIAVAPGPAALPAEHHVAVKACTALADTEQALLQLSPADEKRALKETVMQRWLRTLNAEACALDLAHPMCLSPAEIREWEEAIQARQYGYCGSLDNLHRCMFAAENAPIFSRDSAPGGGLKIPLPGWALPKPN